MGYPIQQNQTSQPLEFLLVLSSDHVSPATGKTPTVVISKNGGAFASPAGAVSEVGNGVYKVAGNATDSNTLGPLWLHYTEASSDPGDEVFPVVGYNPLAADLGLSAALSNVSAVLTAAGLDAVVIESGGSPASVNARQALAEILAAECGVVAGIGTTTVTISAATKPATTRVSATVDGVGNRTAVTITPPA